MSEEKKQAPKVTILSLTEDNLVVLLSHVTVAMANALRRIAMVEVPTLAFHLTTIQRNTSQHFKDEYVAQRIGLIPLDSRCANKIPKIEKCKCRRMDGCVECTMLFSLDVTNRENQTLVVTTADLQTSNKWGVRPVHTTRPIPLLKLLPGEAIALTTVAMAGTGRDDAKWIPTSVASSFPLPHIELNQTKMKTIPLEQRMLFVESCPKKVFKMSMDELSVEVANPHNCTFCNECVRVSEEKLKIEDLVTITPSEHEFILTLESVGQIPPQEIFLRAFAILKTKIDELDEELQEM